MRAVCAAARYEAWRRRRARRDPSATDPKEVFDALFAAPLKKVAPPADGKPLSHHHRRARRDPQGGPAAPPRRDRERASPSCRPWLRIFTAQSREEPQIKRALSAVEPRELRADEAKNRADVEVFLRKIAAKFVRGELSMADIEKAVKRELGIDLDGKLHRALQAPPRGSKAIYGDVRTMLSARVGFTLMMQIEDRRSKPTQRSADFDSLRPSSRGSRRSRS